MNFFNNLLSLGSAFFASQRAAGELGLSGEQFKELFGSSVDAEQSTAGLGDFFNDSFYSTLKAASVRRHNQSRGRGSDVALNYAMRLSSPEYNSANSAMSTHRLYEHTAAGQMAALDIMQDRRFRDIFKGSSKEADAQKLVEALQSGASSTVSELGNTQRLLSTFSTLFEGVEGIGDVFNARVATNKRILRANRDQSAVKTPLKAIAAITRFESASGTSALPGHVKRLGRGGLATQELQTLDKFANRLKSEGIEFTHQEKDIFNIKTKVGGKEKDLKFARFRVKDDSFLVPVSDLGEYVDEASGASLYYRDASGSVLYSPTGKVLDIDKSGKSTVKSGMEHMFGEDGKIFSLLKDVQEGNVKSLGDVMFGLPGDSDEDAFRMFEYIDTTKDPRLSLARKAAQVKVMTEDAVPSGVRGVDEFNEYTRQAAEHGLELLPYGSPGSVGQNKYFYREVERDQDGRVLSTRTPSFIEAALGQVSNTTGDFVSESARSRRPVKAFVDPYRVINPGSQRALRAVTGATGQAGMSQLYAFRSGAFRDLMSGPMAPFVHGSWYLTRKGMEESGNVVSEGTRVRIDPLGEGERLQHAGSHFRIDKRDSAGQGLAYNPELDRFMDKVRGMTSDDPEERRRLIQEELAQNPFSIRPDDFLGQQNARSHVSSIIADAGGQGDMTLIDLKEGDDFWEVVLGRESGFGEGIKTDGSMTSTESSLFNRLTPQQQEDFTKTLQERVEAEANQKLQGIRDTRKSLATTAKEELKAKYFDPIKEERKQKLAELGPRAKRTKANAPSGRDFQQAARFKILQERAAGNPAMQKEYEAAMEASGFTSKQRRLASLDWEKNKDWGKLKGAVESDMLSDDLLGYSRSKARLEGNQTRLKDKNLSAKARERLLEKQKELQGRVSGYKQRLRDGGLSEKSLEDSYKILSENHPYTPSAGSKEVSTTSRLKARRLVKAHTTKSLADLVGAGDAQARTAAREELKKGLLKKQTDLQRNISSNTGATPAARKALKSDKNELNKISQTLSGLSAADSEEVIEGNLKRRAQGAKTTGSAAADRISRSYRQSLVQTTQGQAKDTIRSDYERKMEAARLKFEEELKTTGERIQEQHPMGSARAEIEAKIRSEMMSEHVEKFMKEIDPDQAFMNPELQKLTGISTFIGEGRNLAKGGNTINARGETVEVNNIRMARAQQESAVAAISGLSPNTVTRGYTRNRTDDVFHSFMQRELGEAYKEEDTQAMVSHLLTMQDFFKNNNIDEKGQREILGGVFGLEQGAYFEKNVLNTQEGQDALRSLGLDGTFVKSLKEGVKNSTMAWGLSALFARDSSSVMAGNDAKMERRFIDHIFGQMMDKNSPMFEDTKRLWETIQDKITTADPVYSSTLARYNKMSSGKSMNAPGTNILDFTKTATRADRQQILNKVFEEGGYLKHESGHIYVPSQMDVARLSIKEEGGGRLLEDMDIADTYTNVHKLATKNLEDLEDSEFQAMKRSVSSVAVAKTVEVFRAPFEGRLKGAISGLLIANLNNEKSAERLGYGVGLSKKSIQAHFKSAMRNASEAEISVLKELERKVLDEGMNYAVAAWQNPQIGPESASVFSGYYDKTLDSTGAVRVDIYGEGNEPGQAKSTFRRQGGFMSGKPSTDFDGDRAAVMMMGASSKKRTQKEAEQYWSDQFQLISKASLQKQYNRQRDWDKLQRTYASTIKKNLGVLLKSDETVGRAAEAYIKGAGQADIGPVSNTLSMLHRMNYMMGGTGGISNKTQHNLTNFLQAAEQEAISFKHTSMTPRQMLESRIKSIFDNQDVDKGLDELFGLLNDLGFDQAKELDSKNAKTLGSFAFARASMISMAASKKGEKVTGQAVINAFNTGVADSEFALHLLNPEQSESLLDAAIESLPASFRGQAREEMEKYKGNIGELISALNGYEKSKAQINARNSGAVDKAREAIETVAEHVKGTMQNKYARVGLIGGAVSAGVYAMFNKGYDDTPLSDIPPPPPGRGIMSPRNADLESVANGNLLNDNASGYNRDSSAMAQAMNSAVDQESNIQAPSSIIQKSYLNSATARISNRGMIIDRTNPVEYARAIQARIPGSQVGVNINYNHRLPSDIEREL